jgi:feruloyl esterase
MMMSQRYPGHFDGIVAGAPAMRTNFSNLGLRIATEALNAVAPKDARGLPQTRQALSDADRRLVVDRFLESCDALDGAKDGLVFATQACRFDPQVLQCRAGKNASCLTAAQVQAVKAVMGEKKASDGRQVYPGYLFDTGIIATSGLAGVLVGTPIPEGVAPAARLDIDAAAARAADARAAVGDTNAWTNLSTFQGRGGKLLFFHGVSDPWFSALDTVQYYQQMARDTGPVPVEEWSRLFLVPGMGHCNGGERTLDRFNMLEAIARWVEQGAAPDRIVATGASMPGESRPLCPFPAYPYLEGGDPKSAASYSCRK